MHLSPRRLAQAVAIPAALFCALSANAATVQIDAFGFTPGSGYGAELDESSGTLLNVVFSSSAFAPQSFALLVAGDSMTFDVGTITFNEPRSGGSNGGISANETDNLGVGASFTFILPFGTPMLLTATGMAVEGPVHDAPIDFTLAWGAQQIAFGTGGLLGLSMNTLTFAQTGDTATQRATVTLLQAPTPTTTLDPAPSAVPEPGSLALAGLALAGVALARRRRS